MARVVVPKIFLLAETRLIQAGRGAFLSELGVPGWKTDAASEAEELLEIAGKSCYLSFSTELNKNLTRVGTRDNATYLQEGIIGVRHGSVLEHATITMAFVDVSRVLTHELVRHRPGVAISQVSGRYVRSDDIGYFLPAVIRAEPRAVELFARAFGTMEAWVSELEEIFRIDEMKDFSLKKALTSAFRRVVGNGQANHVVWTANHRALRHVIQERTNRGAEEEIRHAFAEVFRLVSGRCPALYADGVAEDVAGIPEITFGSRKV